MVLTARLIEAPEALAMGLVTRVVPHEKVLEAAFEHAERIAANAPVAVRLAKKAAYRSFDADVDTALELAATYQAIAQNTADHLEAVDAILTKREPDFKGD